jgi:peptidoglycan/LPS O-acetylase OafA/YrhL
VYLRLDVGVTIFFLISAFLLYRPFAAARIDGAREVATGAFAWRRFLRVLPAYWAALLVITLWLGPGDVLTPSGFVDHVALLKLYDPATIVDRPIQVAWTLGVELSFYAFLPLYAGLMRLLPAASRAVRVRQELIGLAALVVLSAGYKVVLLWTGTAVPSSRAPEPALVALPGYLDQFAAGMALAVVSVARPEAGARRPWAWWSLAATAFAIACVPGLLGLEHFSPGGYLLRDLLFTLVAVGLMVPAAFPGDGRGAVRRILASPVLRWLGTISFGIYLYHFAVLVQLGRWGLKDHEPVNDIAAWLAAAVVGAIVLAAASFYLLERPLMRLGSVVGRRREPAAATTRALPSENPA